MGFNRGHFFSALAGLIAGALLIGALPGLAATGDNVVLGEKNTSVTITRLNTRGGLRVDNFKAGNPALILNTAGATPPMQVSSTGLVTNLNADLVDGKEGSWYRPLGRHCGDDNGVPPGTDYSCDMSITLTQSGTFYLSGTGKATGDGLLTCKFLVDGSPVANSLGEVTIGSGEFGTCASSVGVDVSAGARTVQFLLDPHPDVGAGVVSAFLIFIPTE